MTEGKKNVHVDGFESSSFFEQIQEALENKDTRSQILSKFNKVFEFNVDGKQTWTLDFKDNESAGVYVGKSKNSPDCVLTMSDKVCNDVMSGKKNPQVAFFGGELKMSGDIMLGLSLQELRKYQGGAPVSKL
ncbi:non-specific lipid-transfer protein [Acrasis kona]|uniref:Non-specific lipid-transfer protein n=1 Tax=Acrasis kona TaxID=1008807 RepID=A0AAW2YX80_9EUKA